nr:oxysterol-binding protein-related protein 1D-like isoform X1 [Aegilops tauschii subsp. strangulata]
MLRQGGRGRDPSRRRCRRLNTSSPRRRQASPSLSLGPQLPDLLAASGRLHSNLFYAGGHGPGPGGFVPGEGERSSSVLLSIWAVPGSSSCPGMDGAGLLFFLYYTQISKVALTALCYHASTLMLSTASMMESSASMLSFGVACDELVMISSVGKRHIIFIQFYLSGGSASESDPDTASQAADAESDEDQVAYFGTREFFCRQNLYKLLLTNGCDALESIGDSRSYTAKPTKYPIVKRRDKLPEPKEKEKPIGLLWSIIKENLGKERSLQCLSPCLFQ